MCDQDEKKLGWLCWFGFHKWSVWKNDGNGIADNVLGGSRPVLMQSCRCLRCHKEKRRIVYYNS